MVSSWRITRLPIRPDIKSETSHAVTILSLRDKHISPLRNTTLIQDFPYELQLTTVVGLFDDSITIWGIGKHFLSSVGGVSGCFRAMMLPEATFVEASVVDPRRPSPSPPRLPAV